MDKSIPIGHKHCKRCGCVMYEGKKFPEEGIIDPSGEYCPICFRKIWNWDI